MRLDVITETENLVVDNILVGKNGGTVPNVGTGPRGMRPRGSTARITAIGRVGEERTE